MESLPFEFQKRPYWEFYCPVCKAQRRSFYWPSPRVKHYLMLGFLGLVLVAVTWSWFNFKGIFLMLPLWVAFEFAYRAKARQSLVCPHCGFDPYLYKHDPKLARQKIEDFFKNKHKDNDKTPVDSVTSTTNENPKK